MLYIENRSTEPAYNLALEQHFFEHLPQGESCFMLWQNRDAVIIGRYQNTLEEINEPYISAHGIQVVRRMTGGGAVYHDLGNLNYSIICDVADMSTLNFRFFCEPIAAALQRMGVDAHVLGRNDILVEGKKISGSAQHMCGGRLLHHGTLLFSTDLVRMAQALTPAEGTVHSESSKSVRSRVTNISNHLPRPASMEQFWQLVKEEVVCPQHMREYAISQEDHQGTLQLCKTRYRIWDWNYGLSPKCSIQKVRRVPDCGTLRIGMNVEQGLISDFSLRGDYFSIGDSSDLSQRLIGVSPDYPSLVNALRGYRVEEHIYHLTTDCLLRAILE